MSYYKEILAEILAGKQPELENFISIFFEGNPLPDKKSFEDMSIQEAINFLNENWEYLKIFLR